MAMHDYRIRYKLVCQAPDGSTYEAGPYLDHTMAPSAGMARMIVVADNAAHHRKIRVLSVTDLDAAYDRRAQRAEAARNR